MKIGHISDIHWLDTTGARPADFLNKRLSGAFNLLVGRAKKHSKETARLALETLKDKAVDHLIVAGDLSNLALPGEFSGVKKVLNTYFEDAQMTIVPGNHDFYTHESLKARRFEQMIYAKRPGDIDLGTDDVWPFVNIRGDVALIGLNSAQPRPWFVAAGRLGDVQLEALEKALARPEIDGKFKIVALHHHLFQVVIVSYADRYMVRVGLTQIGLRIVCQIETILIPIEWITAGRIFHSIDMTLGVAWLFEQFPTTTSYLISTWCYGRNTHGDAGTW